MHGKISADTVGNQNNIAIVVVERLDRRADFLPRFPRGIAAIINPLYPAIGKECFVVFTLIGSTGIIQLRFLSAAFTSNFVKTTRNTYKY